MSSPAIQLLDDLRRRGVELRANGDLLEFRPPSAVTPELRARMKALKPELLRLVRRQAAPTESPAPSAALTQPPLFHVSEGSVDYGDVCAGWSHRAWAQELRRKAQRCKSYRLDIAFYYLAWSADIERRLGIPSDTEINS